MSSQVRAITFDCADPERLADFWAAVLGYTKREPPPEYPTWAAYLESLGIPEGQWTTSAAAVDPEGIRPRLLFLKVPEGKIVKNRVHLDLTPERTMDEEVARLQALGAVVVQRFEVAIGPFTVMRDPEGNEFCVETGPDDEA
jgi:catechol 2,3-dioxygenase-like lactoylglutathione lyase family enzyme